MLRALELARAQGEDAGAAARLVMQSRALHSRVRSRAADRLFGVARWHAQLDARIRHAAELADGPGKPAPEARDRWRLAAWLCTQEGTPIAEVARVLGLPVAVVEALGSDGFLHGLAGADLLAARHAMPRWLCGALTDERGEAFADALCTALNGRAPLFVRARDGAEALQRELAASQPPVGAQRCAFSPVGLRMEGHVNVRGLEAFKAGRLEVQDEGSQLIALCVAPRPGELVMDVCAGAGGKALALHALEKRAHVVGAEPVPSRLAGLVERAARAGARVEAVKSGLGEPPLRRFEGQADAVLLDGPCSGTGALRREPESRWRYGADDVTAFARTQLHLSRLALNLLKPGGRLIYATCSLLRAENEDVVAELLRTSPTLRPLPLVNLLGAELCRALGVTDHTLRLWPHVHGTDGFFVAALQLVVG